MIALLVLLCGLQTAPVASAEAAPVEVVDLESAESSRLAGDWQKAVDAAALRLAAHPDDLRAAEVKVHALLDGEKWQAALDEARRIPASGPRRDALVGEALFRAGRLEELEALVATWTDGPEAPGRALLVLARLRDAQGRGDEATALMRRAVAAAPDDRDVLYHAAGATETRAEALELLARYLERSAGDDEETVTSARGQVALFRALGERAVWTNVRRPDALELPLEPLWVADSGQVVGYVVRARLAAKGRPVGLLLDSGSPGLFVIERIARKNGFQPLAETTVFDGGGDGRHETQRGFFGTFALGELEFADALASVSRQELDPLGRYHGLLGLGAFRGYRVTLDLAARRLRLERDPGTIEGSSYFVVGGQLLVRAETTGNREGLFLFDTGATHTLVADALLAGIEQARVGPGVDLPTYGGLRRGARALADVEVRFQGHGTGTSDLRAVDLSLRSQVGGVEISGFLGLDLLGGKRVVLDTVRQRVTVSAPPR